MVRLETLNVADEYALCLNVRDRRNSSLVKIYCGHFSKLMRGLRSSECSSY